MFQYAAGKALSEFHSTDLALDLTNYQKNNHRNFELDLLNISKVNRVDNKRELITFFKKNIFVDLFSSLFKKNKTVNVYKENQFSFNNCFFSLPLDCYLDGYWQTEKYFNSISDIIQDEFSLRSSKKLTDPTIYKKICRSESVGIHIRRGDYVTDRDTNNFHGILNSRYYKKASSIMMGKNFNLNYFVFTDDKDWVRNHFKFDLPFTIVDEKWNPIYDLFLLSKCSHQIIANSTFSWWAAWLNTNREKLVIAPRKWFGNKKYLNQLQDIIPEGWIKI